MPTKTEKKEDAPKEVEKKKEKMVYAKDDIVPTMKEAKVIGRAEKPAPSPAKNTKDSARQDVDDLIKKKSQTEESAYKDLGGRRKSSTARSGGRPA